MSGGRTTRLSASKDMAGALVKRQLQALVDVIRTRIEADPGAGQTTKLRRAEQAIMHGAWQDAGTALREIEAALNERAAAAEMEAALTRAQAHAEATRQVETVRTGKGPPTRDGFLWLVRKGRVAGPRREAGERYGILYGRARTDAVLSCLNDEPRGGGSGPSDARMRAVLELEAAHQHIFRAMGERAGRRLVALLEAVCGRGETLRERAGCDDREARALEADLLTALDMVAVRFGFVQAAA